MTEADATPQKPAAYKISPFNGYTTLVLEGDLGPETAPTFEADFPKLIGPPNCHIIVNCDHVTGISKAWIRLLLKLTNEIKRLKKEIRFILVSYSVQEIFLNEGVNQAFQTSPNLHDALIELNIVSKKQLDTEFVNPFLTATIQVLKIQASVATTPGKIFLKQDKGKANGDISGSIGLVTPSFNGYVVVCFPESTFLNIMSGMLGETFTSLTSEIIDGAGELINMIFGQAKATLNEKGYGLKTALPSVIVGRDHTVSALTKGPVIVIPFESQSGPFFVEICLSN